MRFWQGTPEADPQLDVNVLIKLAGGVPEAVAYVQVHLAAGLSYNLAARDEFLASGSGTAAELQGLEQQYGVRPIQDVSLTEIDAAAARLQSAFSGDALGRRLSVADAGIAATARLKAERLATGDLQLFKRARDLGLEVDFVGTGRAAARALGYHPRLVIIP